MEHGLLGILTGTSVEFQKLFEETVAREDTLPWEVLHIAQLTHEVIELLRFDFFTE
jgi:hypothetical protein